MIDLIQNIATLREFIFATCGFLLGFSAGFSVKFLISIFKENRRLKAWLKAQKELSEIESKKLRTENNVKCGICNEYTDTNGAFWSFPFVAQKVFFKDEKVVNVFCSNLDRKTKLCKHIKDKCVFFE